MSKYLSTREFNKNIAKWLNYGKRLIITKNGKPLVKIVPVATIDDNKEVATPKRVATPIKVATRTKPNKVATPISNRMDLCPKHPGSMKATCGCS